MTTSYIITSFVTGVRRKETENQKRKRFEREATLDPFMTKTLDVKVSGSRVLSLGTKFEQNLGRKETRRKRDSFGSRTLLKNSYKQIAHPLEIKTDSRSDRMSPIRIQTLKGIFLIQ